MKASPYLRDIANETADFRTPLQIAQDSVEHYLTELKVKKPWSQEDIDDAMETLGIDMETLFK